MKEAFQVARRKSLIGERHEEQLVLRIIIDKIISCSDTIAYEFLMNGFILSV